MTMDPLVRDALLKVLTPENKQLSKDIALLKANNKKDAAEIDQVNTCYEKKKSAAQCLEDLENGHRLAEEKKKSEVYGPFVVGGELGFIIPGIGILSLQTGFGVKIGTFGSVSATGLIGGMLRQTRWLVGAKVSANVIPLTDKLSLGFSGYYMHSETPDYPGSVDSFGGGLELILRTDDRQGDLFMALMGLYQKSETPSETPSSKIYSGPMVGLVFGLRYFAP